MREAGDSPGQERWEAPDLRGRVAIVTGASRGVGRGVALVLGECGATVYVTGRSARGAPARERVLWDGTAREPLAGTVKETAELVTARGAAAGGRGIAVLCDHTDDAQVEALIARVRADHGSLDVLVNNVWGGYEDNTGFGAPFWEQPAARWDAMFGAGVRAHYTAGRLAAPLMLPRGRGLIVNVSVAWPEGQYDGRLVYYLAKRADNEMAWAMAQELRPHGVAAVALSPVGVVPWGWVLSGEELRAVEEAARTPGRTEALLATRPELAGGRTPTYVGRAVAALAADPDVLARTGRVLKVAEVAEAYGFTDVDGRRPRHD